MFFQTDYLSKRHVPIRQSDNLFKEHVIYHPMTSYLKVSGSYVSTSFYPSTPNKMNMNMFVKIRNSPEYKK